MIFKVMQRLVPYYTVITWIVSMLHITQGTALLVGGSTVGTTTILGMMRVRVIDGITIDLSRPVLAVMLITTALLAIGGVSFLQNRSFWLQVMLWMPQQLLIFGAAASAFEAIWVGHYLDGTGAVGSGIIISRSHLIADQGVYIILAIAHIAGFAFWRMATAYAEAVLLRYTTTLEGARGSAEHSSTHPNHH
jgi:hypothetical protein